MRLAPIALVLVAGCRFNFDSGSVTVDQSAIDFAMLQCGSTASLAVTVDNTGASAIAFTAVTNVPGVVTTPGEGTFTAGATTTLTITATSDANGIPGTAMTGELLISLDSATADDISIPVSLTTSGGVVTTDQTTLDFGQVTTGTSHDSTVTVTNTGNASVTVQAGPFAGPPFSVTGTSSFALAAGASQPVDVQFDPTVSQAYEFQLPLAVMGATCAPVPAVAVSGVGTISTVLLDHTTIDFGGVACGTAMASVPLTLTNNNASSFPFTATVLQGPFGAAPASGTVPAMGGASIAVSRPAVPIPSAPGAVTGALQVVITGIGLTNVPLQYEIVGSALASPTTSLDFGILASTKSLSFSVTNSGNRTAAVTMTRSGSPQFSGPSSFQISAGIHKDVTITYSPSGSLPAIADFTLDAANDCALPLTIHVTGGASVGSGM